jgi:hypothetical protein
MHKRSPHQTGRFAALMAGALLAFSGAAPGKECWLDIYDKDNYQGEHQRIAGPAELPNLKSVGNQDWSNRIESLIVGTDAEVLAFRKENFEDEPEGAINHPEAFHSWGKQEIPAYQDLEITFGAGSKEHHLGELRFHRNINSLKLRCK